MVVAGVLGAVAERIAVTLILGDRRVDQTAQMLGIPFRGVFNETQLGHRSQTQAFAERALEKTACRTQAFERLAWVFRGCRYVEGTDEYLGVFEILRNLDIGDRHQTHPRVFHLGGDQYAQLALELLGNAVLARKFPCHD